MDSQSVVSAKESAGPFDARCMAAYRKAVPKPAIDSISHHTDPVLSPHLLLHAVFVHPARCRSQWPLSPEQSIQNGGRQKYSTA